MANSDRLTALDTTFLHLEDHSTAHMHVASVMVFEGRAPALDELVDHIEARLHLVPRYRQRLAYVPLEQGRPVWTDDPHFNPYYHVRHTALPRPADERALKTLAGRLSRSDWTAPSRCGRSGSYSDSPANVSGSSRRRITPSSTASPAWTSPPCCSTPSASPRLLPRPAEPWSARPLPGSAKLLGDALLERSTVPSEMLRGTRALLRRPRRAVDKARRGLVGIGSTALAGINAPAPASPFNVPIGPHRRYTFFDVDLATLKSVKDSLGGTLNDTVLATVALALGRYLRRRGHGHRRAGAEGDGSGLRPCCRAARRARQPGRRDVGAAPGWRQERRPMPYGDLHGNERGQGIRSGRRRAGPHRARRFRAADDPLAGRSAPGSPAVLQPGRDERAGATDAAVPAGPRTPRPLPRGAARPEAGARNRRHELQRQARLRAARRLRRAAEARADRTGHGSGRSASSPRPRASRQKSKPRTSARKSRAKSARAPAPPEPARRRSLLARALPAEPDRRRHRRQPRADRDRRSRRRAPPARSSCSSPSSALTGYPPEDLLLQAALPRTTPRRRSRRSRRHARGIVALVGFPERSPRTSTTPRRARRRRAARRLPQAPPAELRRLRRGALLRARQRRRCCSKLGGSLVGPTVCEDIWQPGSAGQHEPRSPARSCS